MQCKGCDCLIDIYDRNSNLVAYEWHATKRIDGEYICQRRVVINKAAEYFDKGEKEAC